MTQPKGLQKYSQSGEPMTHTVKLSDEVYQGLCQVLEPRETFSDAVGRMIADHKRWNMKFPPLPK